MKLLCGLSLLASATAFTTHSAAFTINAPSVGERVMKIVADNSAHRTRRATIVMDGKANAIRDRITSVKNTKKITMAMKLVAAAKVRRAQDAVIATRPFSETLQAIFGGLVTRLSDETFEDVPLLSPRKDVKKVTVTIITGDRGLCGGYNSFMIKKAEARIKELEASGVEVELILIGKKGIAYFKRRYKDSVLATYETGQNPNSEQALSITKVMQSRYENYETDAIEVFYTKFVSLIASEPSVRTLVPFTVSEIVQSGDEVFQLTTKDGNLGVERIDLEPVEPEDFGDNMMFSCDPVMLVDCMMPLYLNGQILRILQEAIASELAARMQAMQSASDNAGDLAKRLNQEYNRARQASVTQEILEISAGSAAVND